MDGSPPQACGGFEVFRQVINKKGGGRAGASCRQGFFINVRVRFAGANLVGVDPRLEDRKKVIGGLQMADMGGTGVRDQAEGITRGQLPCDGHPVGQGTKDVAKGLAQGRLRMVEVQILGQEGEIFVTGVPSPLVIVGALMRPDLFAESGQVLAGCFCQGAKFFSGMEANQDVPQIKKDVGDRLTHPVTLSRA